MYVSGIDLRNFLSDFNTLFVWITYISNGLFGVNIGVFEIRPIPHLLDPLATFPFYMLLGLRDVMLLHVKGFNFFLRFNRLFLTFIDIPEMFAISIKMRNGRFYLFIINPEVFK